MFNDFRLEGFRCTKKRKVKHRRTTKTNQPIEKLFLYRQSNKQKRKELKHENRLKNDAKNRRYKSFKNIVIN
jgi:hypothetical protein